MSSFRGPFRPGTGATPPYLGRGESGNGNCFGPSWAIFRTAFRREPRWFCTAPRGNGKTVLLDWREREAGSVPGVSAAVLLPSEISDEARLRELPTPTSGWERPAVGEVEIAGRHLGFIWRADGRIEWEPGIPSLMDYTRDALRPRGG